MIAKLSANTAHATCIPILRSGAEGHSLLTVWQLQFNQVLLQVITCKPELLVPANPIILDGVPDLTGLTYLNEPSILHGLNLRYSEDLIYTHAGPVLIAINPFKQVRRLSVCMPQRHLFLQLC